MKVLICGDRNWKDWRKIAHRLIDLPDDTNIMMGDCNGADRIATHVSDYLQNWNLEDIVVFYANWDKHGKKAGPIRNIEMLDEKPFLKTSY